MSALAPTAAANQMRNVEPTSLSRARRSLCQRKRCRPLAVILTVVALLGGIFDTQPAWMVKLERAKKFPLAGSKKGQEYAPALLHHDDTTTTGPGAAAPGIFPSDTGGEISLETETPPSASSADFLAALPIPAGLAPHAPTVAAPAESHKDVSVAPQGAEPIPEPAPPAGDEEVRQKEASLAFLAGQGIGSTVAESVIDVLASGGVPSDAWVSTLEHMKDDQLQRLVRGAGSTKSWGIVFVYRVDPNPMSHRAKVIAASWRSICRAIRVHKKMSFHVIAIDDSGELIDSSSSIMQIDSPNFKRTDTHFNVPNFESANYQTKWETDWREACGTSNLKSLVHVEGKHSIPGNMEMGYDWAAEFDYIINFDSGERSATFYDAVRMTKW